MSFDELLRKISPTLKRIVYRLNSRCSYFNSDDLYQEALMHLWVDFQAGKLSDKTDSYILQGCYFYLKNYLRTHYEKANILHFEDILNAEGEVPCLEEMFSSGHQESSRDSVYCKMLIEQIQNNGLTDREKEVFLLSLEGLTLREIGERLGISHVRVMKLKITMREKCLQHLD